MNTRLPHATPFTSLSRRYPQAPCPCVRRFAARRRDARWRHPANLCPVDRACAGTRPKIYSRKIRSIGGCVPCGSPRGLGRMSEEVLDASAVLAWLKEEAGEGKVAEGIGATGVRRVYYDGNVGHLKNWKRLV